VANAFGTSVGARTVSLKQAVLIAAVFEFAGAMTLGRVVTGTIAGGIARTEAFSGRPEVYGYGMLCALVSSTVWLYVATYYELPVSTTHSIGARAAAACTPSLSFPHRLAPPYAAATQIH
jgi:sodium-dependent phosphate transporter